MTACTCRYNDWCTADHGDEVAPLKAELKAANRRIADQAKQIEALCRDNGRLRVELEDLQILGEKPSA